MESDLPAGSGTPKFFVYALKDPGSGYIDRMQIIKVTTKNGEALKRFLTSFEVGRQKGEDGKIPAVGNTVDLKEGTYTNTIGSTELIGYREDREFDPTYTTYYTRAPGQVR